jgi:hypothetical protein
VFEFDEPCGAAPFGITCVADIDKGEDAIPSRRPTTQNKVDPQLWRRLAPGQTCNSHRADGRVAVGLNTSSILREWLCKSLQPDDCGSSASDSRGVRSAWQLPA